MGVLKPILKDKIKTELSELGKKNIVKMAYSMQVEGERKGITAYDILEEEIIAYGEDPNSTELDTFKVKLCVMDEDFFKNTLEENFLNSKLQTEGYLKKVGEGTTLKKYAYKYDKYAVMNAEEIAEKMLCQKIDLSSLTEEIVNKILRYEELASLHLVSILNKDSKLKGSYKGKC